MAAFAPALNRFVKGVVGIFDLEGDIVNTVAVHA